MKVISNKIVEIKELINEADYILIGAGSGLSTAAGIEYSGKRFQEKFSDYIEKYHFTDMYTAGFYDFETEEEKWAYWARHAYTNNTGMGATKLYKDILKLVENKEYFVITTNADDQFFKSGFDENKIFRVQGSYRYIQCKEACHDKLYDGTKLFEEMIEKTVDFKIPTSLIPKCPVCGGKMEMNLRKDAYFVQDDTWYKQNNKYEDILNKNQNKKVLLLEFGVGFNTPGIIRIPFEQMTLENRDWKLVRFNKDYCGSFVDLGNKMVPVNEDIGEVVEEL